MAHTEMHTYMIVIDENYFRNYSISDGMMTIVLNGFFFT